MKIQDRLTGAFGEKHKDDSDDELGDLAQNPEDFEQEQEEAKKQEKAAAAAAKSQDTNSTRKEMTRGRS